jgi:hypothetical protein
MVSDEVILFRCLLFLFLERLNGLRIPKDVGNVEFGQFLSDLATSISCSKAPIDIEEVIQFESLIGSLTHGGTQEDAASNLRHILSSDIHTMQVIPSHFNLKGNLQQVTKDLQQVTKDLQQVRDEKSQIEIELNSVIGSKIWRASKPIRLILNKLK